MKKRQGGNDIIILRSQVDVSRSLWDLPGSILFSLVFSIHISQLDTVEIFKETLILLFISQSTNIFIIPQVPAQKIFYVFMNCTYSPIGLPNNSIFYFLLQLLLVYYA